MQRRPDSKVEHRRQELQALGYRPGAVQIALDWATNSAEAMAQYYNGDGTSSVDPASLLPRYLEDTVKYLDGLGLKPA